MNEHEIARLLGSGWPELLAGVMLGGPLVGWILYRLAFPASARARRAGTQVVPVPHDALWLCPACMSLNRASALRCYRCNALRMTGPSLDAAAVHEPAAARSAPAPWVPVMATSAAAAASTGIVPTAAPRARVTAGLEPPMAPRLPAAVPVSEPERVPAGMLARLPVGVMAQPRPVPVAAQQAGPPVGPDAPESRLLCPLLRGIGDARIVFMLPRPMPHPDYRCLAGQRPLAIDPGHQASHCLSADYHTCEQYMRLAHRVSGVGAPDVAEPNQAAVRTRLSG